MAKPNSRQTLIDYCLRALGAPVVEINVDDDQVEDRVDEALQFYQHYHADSIEKVFLKHKVTNSELTLGSSTVFTIGETITGGTSGATAKVISSSGIKLGYNKTLVFDKVFVANETITGGTSSATATVSAIATGDIENGYLTIPDLVTDVVQIFPLREGTGTGMFDVQYQMHLNDMYSLGYMGSLVEYEMAQQWLSMLDLLVTSDDKHISFDRHKNQLRIDMDWNKEVIVGGYIVVECYRIIDPNTFTDVYNDYFLKRYLTALIKMQWGVNLSKFEGMVMPGGVTFNGRQILEDAKEEIEKLNEEVRLNWEQPVDFYTG